MKTIKKIIIGYVFYSSPLILILFICTAIKKPVLDVHPLSTYSNFILILILECGVWTLTALGLTISMIFSAKLRNTVLVKLSGIKERDEREVQIVGKALKSSYLTGMTILLCLLSISFLQVTITKKSPDNLAPGELQRSIQLGFHAELTDSDAIITGKEGYDIYYQYNDVPFSVPSLILLMLVWQIASYRYVSRKALKHPALRDCD